MLGFLSCFQEEMMTQEDPNK